MKPFKPSLTRRILAASLLISGVAAPALADGTPANTNISNTATASYEDPNNPTVSINATSNTVVVTVAEVAGITVTPVATTDRNGGTVLPNDVVDYVYRVTNVGNDTTHFHIPDQVTVTGPGTAGTVQISTDGGTTWTNVTPGGMDTNTPVLNGIAPGGSVLVRVPVTITALAPSGATIRVLLGNTGTNDNSTATQNQPNPTAPAGNDVYTVDASGVPGEVAGDPVNGEREASSVQQVIVGSQPQAFAAILKTRSAYSTNSTPAVLTDDTITYGLSLRVDATAPSGSTGLSPAGLVGTTVTGIGSNRILVTDAIPDGTVLTGTPTAPNADWTPVYTTAALGTPADQASWSSTNPGSGVTRVGFVYNASPVASGGKGPIAPGTMVNGFSFTVTTSGITGTTTIANIAQVFGQTEGGGTTLVYDESGDQSPSNFNDDGSPGSNTPTTGVANPANDGVDSNNNNTGTGPGGEDNVLTIAAPGTILNGPLNRSDAVGPTNNNDDFTNRSTPIPPGITPGTMASPATLNPDSITFTNTLSNPSSTDTLTNVLLVPDTYNFTAASGEVLPPTNTTVTLTYGTQTAVYTYNGTNFVFTSGSAIVIPTLLPNNPINYTVAVDLPADTPLSTDTEKGFSIPIFAFQDSNNNARPDASDVTQNRTIDRVYTGFLQLKKAARILDANGNQIVGFTNSPNAAFNAEVRPGRLLEYKIDYKNISIAPVGAGNTILNANNVVITEDGQAGTNNWAVDNPTTGIINTSNVLGSAQATFGTVQYLPSGDRVGTTAAADVTKYVNTVGIPIQPGGTGQLIFRRRIN
jgi:hypothetical protein